MTIRLDQIDPSNLKALYLRGSAYSKQERYDASIRDFTFLLSVESDNIDALLARGNAYSKTDLTNEAIKDLSRILEINPDHVAASFARAACYNSIGMFSNAIEDYNSALIKDQSGMGSGSRSPGKSDMNRRRNLRSIFTAPLLS
jgi:tetratricopeptide (TPR) repeat protein